MTFTPFDDVPLDVPTQPSVVIAGYEVRCNEDRTEVCYADLVDVLGVTIGWLRKSTGRPAPVGAVQPTQGRPPALYPVEPLLAAVRKSTWKNKRHVLAALEADRC